MRAAPPAILHLVAIELIPIFEQEYRALRPRAPMPPFHIRFRRFTSLNTTIRLREGAIHVSLSDLLEGAPEGPFSLNWAYDKALAEGRLYGLTHQGLWFHVGTPQAVTATEAMLANG